MKKLDAAVLTLVTAILLGGMVPAYAASCLRVTLTGTMGGPNTFGGLAGPGTLVEFGDDDLNDCKEMRLQFDAGRGTNVSSSAIGIRSVDLDLLAFTHLHSDHVDGFSDLMQNRWHNTGINPVSNFPPLDILCSDRQKAAAPANHKMDCRKLAQEIGRAFTKSGEIAQRISENAGRNPGGPSALTNVIELSGPGDAPAFAWRKTSASGTVTVSFIRVNHIAGSVAYRVDTPAGSVVIGGDAVNDLPSNTRPTSTSDQVKLLATTPDSAEVMVHSAISNVLAPGSGFPPPFFVRQSTAQDLGTMAEGAGAAHLMLTHLIPSIGAGRAGPAVVNPPLIAADWIAEAVSGGFSGNVIVGPDRTAVQIP